MLGRLYKGEFKKLFKPKSLIVIAIIMILIFLLIAFAYSLIADLFKESGEELVTSGSVSASSYEDARSQIAELEYGIEVLEADENLGLLSGLLGGGGKKAYETQIAALNYIIDHSMYGQTIPVYSNEGSLLTGAAKVSADGFMNLAMSLLMVVLTISMITVAAGIYGKEFKNGTLKLVLMRPVTRNGITTAKLLALITVTVASIGITALLCYLYGLAVYGAADSMKIMYVFNSSKAFMAGRSLGTFLLLCNYFISALSFAVFTFALSVLFKSRTPALVLGILVYFDIASLILSIFKLTPYAFSSSINFLGFIGSGMGIADNANFWISFPLYIVYMTLFIGGTYFIINKRDIV